MPALILGATLAAFEVSRAGTARWQIRTVSQLIHGGLIAVLGLAVALSLASAKSYRLWDTRRGLAMNEQAVALAIERAGSNAVVVAKEYSGSVYFYSTVPVVRFDLISARSWQHLVETAQARGQSICALLWVREVEPFRKKAGGGWTEVGAVGNARLLVPIWTRPTT